MSSKFENKFLDIKNVSYRDLKYLLVDILQMPHL